MQMNSVLNLFIGLALTFGTVAMLVTAVTEAFASALKWRSNTLLDGLKQLLNDPQLQGLALGVLNHAAVNPLSSGTARAAPPGMMPDLTAKPSYIEPAHFAAALIDVIQRAGQADGEAPAELRQAITGLPDQQLRTMLIGMYDRTANEAGAFHKAVANWFDSAMDRLSGVYKRKIQLVSFAIAVAIAAILNVDAIHLGSVLWSHPGLTAQVNLAADANHEKVLQVFTGTMPLGWAAENTPKSGGVLLMVVGWLFTASAALLGAPFWFDTLQRFVQVRGSGPAPDEKRQ